MNGGMNEHELLVILAVSYDHYVSNFHSPDGI
jgi:hypothetical protein